jgi:hypothetical protein
MGKILKLFLTVALFSNLFIIPISAQNKLLNERQNLWQYIDTIEGFSFQLPIWFNVDRSTYYRDALEVKESGEFSFRIYIRNFREFSELQKNRNGSQIEYPNDIFREVVKEAVRWSLHSVGTNGESFGRIDSVVEYRTTSGLRILAVYRTQVNQLVDGTIDTTLVGPLYCVDISEKKKGTFIEIDYFGFDMRFVNYKELAKSIALSIELK